MKINYPYFYLLNINQKPVLTREHRHIRFWSKGEMAESAHERVQHYMNLQDVDKARLLISEWIIETP